MSVTSPHYLNCSTDIVSGLIGTVTVALTGNFPTVQGDPVDIEMVLDAVRVLRPKLAELETFVGILHMLRGQWEDAIRTFSWVNANAPQFSYAKALLAFCLSANGDPSWRQSATEVMQHDQNHDTVRLIRVLEAREDLRAAVRTYRKSGKFELPTSIVALQDDEQSETAQQGEVANEIPAAVPVETTMPGQSYLRI